MRPLALLGLVVSIILAAITAGIVNNDVHAGRTEQDRSLQSAVNAEVSLVSSGTHQTKAAIALMAVNPAVHGLLDSGHPAASTRAADLNAAALALGAVKATAVLPLSAACLDNAAGVQLVCAQSREPTVFPSALSQEFGALAATSPEETVSGAFVSPVTRQLSVALISPLEAGRRLRGFIHLDVSLATARGSNLIVDNTPGVTISLASYVGGRLLLDSDSSHITDSGLTSPTTIPVKGSLTLGRRPHPTLSANHRAMLATLPLRVGASSQKPVVVATAIAPDPSFFNTINPGESAGLALALLMFFASVAGLALSQRQLARELFTDTLTDLRNRRALMDELPRACQRATDADPAFLWFFDLNGFKRYNDSFGHVAGDRLLRRLGQRLREVVRPHGQVYRLGGDEFCVLITGPIADPHALFGEAREALTESGGAFTVDASGGAVELPREAAAAEHALRLADQRMYREKAGTRAGAAELITAVLHAALAQRHPDLGEHSDDVAGDVELLARSIGMEQDAIDLVVKAGDLHDVGKLGIPDEIITKPGPLTASEWDFMKQHTVMGEQIIAAAGASLGPIGPLVRASHERWDGAGYPDGLKGDAIPLGARIITICDSFRAMLDERVYKPSMTVEEALAELRRCAGSQFDPELVELFCHIVAERSLSAPARSEAA